MTGADRHLRLVPPCPTKSAAVSRDLEDLGLTLIIFLVAAVPLASRVAGVGEWSEGSLGLGTVGVLLAGRELCAWLVASCRLGRRR